MCAYWEQSVSNDLDDGDGVGLQFNRQVAGVWLSRLNWFDLVRLFQRNIPEPLFTPTVGSACALSQSGNVLITFGNTTYVNGIHPSPYSLGSAMVRIKEVTREQPAQVVFDLALFDYSNVSASYRGCFAYRSYRVPDLYAHPALPVTDLTIQIADDGPYLQFSGDATRTYTVQASSDAVQWDDLGVATFTGDGNFDFVDEGATGFQVRFYRVVTR